MQARLLVVTSATALLVAGGTSVAQDEMASDGMVRVSVAGTMVEVTVSLAAQACGLDEATIRANAFTAEMDAQETGEATTTAPDPMETAEDILSADDAAPTEMATDTAADPAEATGTETQPDASDSGEMASADVADEAATAAAAGEDTTGAADAATTADNSADSATADEAAETVDGLDADATAGTAGMAVCEIDQATAEQFGLPSGG